MKLLMILNDPPYGSERAYNGLRLVGSLARQEGHEVKVFLMGDAAACAKAGQKVPSGYYNVQTMLGGVTRRGGSVGVCGTCMDARGIIEAELSEGTRRSTLGRLALITASPAYKCPGAPYETAMLLESACRERGIRHQTEIDLYAAEPGPMGVAGPEVSRAVRQMVEAKGIRYHPEYQVTEVQPEQHRIRFSNGAEAEYDLLAYVPPLKVPKTVRDAGLIGESGWIAVDRHSLETRYPRVFALGDVTSIPLKMGKPLPKAGVFAHKQAEVVACNVAREITGKRGRASYEGWGECFIESGDGRGGFGKGNFYAEPLPQVSVEPPTWQWHAAKILFEKWWLWRWF